MLACYIFSGHARSDTTFTILMMTKPLCCGLIVLWFVGTSGISRAAAREIETFGFRLIHPCIGTSPECADRILVEGVLPSDAAQQFESYLLSQFQMPPRGMSICFNSPGGSVTGAMSLGKVIRRDALNTCVEHSYSSDN